MDVIVRPTKREELEQVNALRRQVNNLHVQGRPDFFRPGFARELEQYVYTVFDEENSDVIVAACGDAICGYAMVKYVDKPLSPYMCARRFYRVEEFGVDEACRRRGVGSKLLAYMKTDARQKGFERMELDMWAFNSKAFEFYENEGFSVYRRHMELNLTEE